MATEDDALKTLIDLYENSTNIALKSAVAEGLGIAGGAAARAHLIQALGQTSNIELRSALVRALGQATHR
ncbi:HEAT repeat domain-containing protein [Cupriavidus necator]